ncbi:MULTISPECIES: hypothetical protein [Streptomyces]|uniref:Uncharacterized protein n=2 Tax=Streptomyces TaxID=1883 RepID=A0A1E7LV80_9ACTN|nr:hypothetical protein [Streptomyces nanshensis]OEV20132.1 hypothetical protein AN221_13770 [Streptomyces nanshensis]
MAVPAQDVPLVVEIASPSTEASVHLLSAEPSVPGAYRLQGGVIQTLTRQLPDRSCHQTDRYRPVPVQLGSRVQEEGFAMELGTIGIQSLAFTHGDRVEARDAAAEVEELGYGAVLLGGSPGGNPRGDLVTAARPTPPGPGRC